MTERPAKRMHRDAAGAPRLGCRRGPVIQDVEYLRMFRTVIPLRPAVLELHFDSRRGVLPIIHLRDFVHVDLIHT